MSMTKLMRQESLLAIFNEVPVDQLYLGLCVGTFRDELQIEEMTEPTIGVNGYARQAINMDITDWPTTGETNGEPYIESKQFTFTASGGDFDKGITRMFVSPESTSVTGDVYILGSPLENELVVTDSFSAKLRIYLR